MTALKKEDLTDIEVKLAIINEKIGNKWIIPIIVALITGLMTLLSLHIQYQFQKKFEKEKLLIEDKYKFQTKVTDLLNAIDRSFYELCYFDSSRNEELEKSLEKYYRLFGKGTSINIDEDTIQVLKQYSEDIAEKVFQIAEEKPNLEDKKSLYRESMSNFEKSKSALKDLL